MAESTTMVRKAAPTGAVREAELKDEAFCEAVTALTALLNHEFEGPLATILANTQILLLTGPGGDAAQRRRLEQIEAAALAIRHATQRAGHYTRAIFCDGGD